MAQQPSPLEALERLREKGRRQVVATIFIIYWLLIFEGALRKWALPAFHKQLFFIRDPFVLWAYFLAFKYHLWPKHNKFFQASLLLAGMFILLIPLQLLVEESNPLVGLYGFRNYFFYIPLAFLIGAVFKGQDLARLARQTLIIGIPIAALAFFQFKSPESAWINRTYDPDARIMLVTNEIVRTSGTFTVSQGQALFTGSLIAFLLTLWLLPAKDRPLRRWLLALSVGSAITCFAVCGSRSVFFFGLGAISTAAIAGALMHHKDPRKRLRGFLRPSALLLLGMILYVTVFNQAFRAMQVRQKLAEEGEGSTIARAFSSLTSITHAFPKMSPTGVGIGYGSNAGGMLLTGHRMMLLDEDEWPRIVEEAGVLGLFYIGMRIALVVYILANAVKATQRSRNPLPLIIGSFTVPILLNGQITLQGTINGYGWLFAGFCFAANQLGTAASKTAPVPQPVGEVKST